MSPNPSNLEILQAVRFHPFFQGLEESTALSLLAGCHYKQFAKGKIILHGDTTRTGLFFIINGLLEVFVEKAPVEEIIEIVQQGELIGLSGLAEFLGIAAKRDQEAMVGVRAIEEVSALLIPFSVIERRWDDAKVRDYLLAQMAIRLRDVYASFAEQIKLSQPFLEKTAILTRVGDVMKEPAVTVSREDTVMAAAGRMSQERVSSVAVVEAGKLVGIVTEKDIVSRVVARGVSSKEVGVGAVMTEGPLTIGRFDYYYDALSKMLLHSVKHLPVLYGGELVGMVTLSDLLRKKSESFIKTIRSIEEADEAGLPQIKEAIYDIVATLLRDQVPTLKLLDTVTALYDRLAARVVVLAEANLATMGLVAPGPYAFYQMGSSGRREQIMLTDQDHFLVYCEGLDRGGGGLGSVETGSDSVDESGEMVGSGDSNEPSEVNGQDGSAGSGSPPASAHVYFSRLGEEITRLFEMAGYKRCVGLMMASETQWRGSITLWAERLRGWMIQSSNNHLLLAQNFFSYRMVYGSFEVHQRFEAGLIELLGRSKIFLYRLAQVEREHVIVAPSTGAVGGSSVGKSFFSLLKREGKKVNLKTEVLFPFHHGLQILSLVNGVLAGSPVERLEKLVARNVIGKSFAEELVVALEEILALYIRLRWDNGGGGAVVEIARLSTREKQRLIVNLKTFRELQSLVFAHFSL